MITPQRKLHHVAWWILTPLLLALIVVFSQPQRETAPVNNELPAAAVGKGVLP